MRSEKEIYAEIEYREENSQKPKTYEEHRSNRTVINTLKAVLGLPSAITWHEEVKGVKKK